MLSARVAAILLLGGAVVVLFTELRRSESERRSMQDDRTAIDAIRDGFADAYARGDVETLLSFYDPEYVDASEGTAVRGREEMRTAFEATFSRFDGRLEIVPEEVLINGTWAIERGRFSIHLVDRASGTEQVSHRRYLELLTRRAGGRWYILRDLDNEVPPQGGRQ